MNIQIYGKMKCFASRSAERYFKERKIKYQFVNILEKGLSNKELNSILVSIKNIDLLFDKKSPLYSEFNIEHIKRNDEDKKIILLENPRLLQTPIVRDCDSKKSTVGEQTMIWKEWILLNKDVKK
jgi:arsenate reductase-like glutaredoxin family protein